MIGLFFGGLLKRQTAKRPDVKSGHVRILAWLGFLTSVAHDNLHRNKCEPVTGT